MTTLKAFVIVLFFALAAQGFKPADWYHCDTSRCLRPRCRCATANGPKPRQKTPQFIYFTHDDSVNSRAAKLVSEFVSTANNPNGCPIPVTWFARSQYSSCKVIRDRFLKGDEFACHTITHPVLDMKTPKATVTHQIIGSRDYLVNRCKLPAELVTGFRATYRYGNPRIRKILYANNFTYDSSQGFKYQPMDSRPWPFTMNNGLPDPECGKACFMNETYDGMWQVPVYTFAYDGQNYILDPGMGKVNKRIRVEERPTINVLKAAFDQAYHGNRAPLAVGAHDYFWADPQRMAETKEFIEYALSHKNVWFVTIQQLIEWLKDPVPAKGMREWLGRRCWRQGNMTLPPMDVNSTAGLI